MNKGLELIEAFHLFPVRADQLEVVVHPQSIVHCLVFYTDGSVLAQLGPSRHAHADRAEPCLAATHDAPTARLDLVQLATLTFEAPDEERFPALRLAREALLRGGSAPRAERRQRDCRRGFPGQRIGFLEIAAKVAATIEAADGRGMIRPLRSLDDALAADSELRKLA